MERERCDQARSGDNGKQDPRRGELPGRADLGEPVGEERDAEGQENEPEDVEALGGGALATGEDAEGSDERDGADRDVDEEDPAPADAVDDEAAQGGAEDRREHDGDRDDAHDAAHPLRPGCIRHHHLADGQEHPTADPLDHSECDQLARATRRSPQRTELAVKIASERM